MKQLPTPEEKNPRIGQIYARRAEFDAQRPVKKSELAVVRERQKRDAYGNADENVVRRALGQQPLPDATSDRLLEQTLLKEIHDLNIMIDGLDRAIRNERSAGSRLVLEDKEVKAEREKRGGRASKALIELHSATHECEQFNDALEDAGCDVGQYRINLNGLGSPRDLSGGFFYAFRDLIDAGYMAKSDLPKVYK